MRSNPSVFKVLLAFTALALTGGSASAQTLSIYMSSPTTQSTFVSGATTETFNSLTPGTLTTTYIGAIGSYAFTTTAKGQIIAADQFGGATNGTSGTNYLSIGAQSGSSAPVTITLSSSANYFGIWTSAIDTNNGISFYNGTTLLTHFSASDITSLLSGPTVTAVNGTVYNSSTYYGNPNNGQNAGEPYVYLNFIASGITFNRIVLDNSGTTGTGFETDNHSVYSGSVPVPPGTSVFVEAIPVPEPGAYAAMILGLVALLVSGHRLLARRPLPLLA